MPTYKGFSGVEVFVTIDGHLFLPADLQLEEVHVRDEDEGDNEVTLICEDSKFKIADSAIIKVGGILGIKWGYTGGDLSAERSGYVIMKPSTHYSMDGIYSHIKATTKSATLAARRAQKSYGETSLRNIVSEIAARNGLNSSISGGSERVPAFSHANWSDRQVLRVLADRFGYQLSFENDTIVFARRDYGAVPRLELVFGQGEDSNILTATVNVDAKKSLGDNATTAISINPYTKEVVKGQGSGDTRALAISGEDGHSWLTSPSPTTAQGKNYKSGALKWTELSKTDISQIPPDVGNVMSTPDYFGNNTAAMATGELTKKRKKKGELTIYTEGIPSAKARDIVHVRGLAKRDSGNWYTCCVEHRIGQESGFTTQFELARHGNNTKTGEKNKEPLNKQLPSNTKSKDRTVSVDAETGSIK